MIEITGASVPEAYEEALFKILVFGRMEDSRNGAVLSFPEPVELVIADPTKRVLFNPVRDANPFFHVMEFCWMLAGSNDAKWLSQFNKRMMDYADDGILRGAYGWRWVNPRDQLGSVISLLKRDPNTRQAVLSMWDVLYDGPEAWTSDRPCNTHIYFRVSRNELDMTVCNRSNDLIWGMLGANAVHMTMLHELISSATGIPLGVYRVLSNNVHTYVNMPNYDEIMSNTASSGEYQHLDQLTPLLAEWEDWEDLRRDCIDLIGDPSYTAFRTNWVLRVAKPMHDAYLNRDQRDFHISCIEAPDWRLAAFEWWERRKNNTVGGNLQGLQ